MYQVLWAQLLALGFGNTVEANATVLAVFMAGWGSAAPLPQRVGSRGALARSDAASPTTDPTSPGTRRVTTVTLVIHSPHCRLTSAGVRW